MRKYLYNHTNFDTGYEVEGYPWGFRLKTNVRYWVETNDRANGGQRFCKCTLNPKTNEWCKPKKSIYFPIVIIVLNDDGYVKFTHVDYNNYHSEDELKAVFETHKENLTDYQVKKFEAIKRYLKASENIDFTCNYRKTVEIR